MFPSGAYGQSTASTTLTGREAVDHVIGNTLVYSDPDLKDILVVMHFKPDGRAVMQTMANGVASEVGRREGVWSIDDQERLCVVEDERSPVDEDCLGMTITGNVVHPVPDGLFGEATITLVKGNSHKL